MPDSHSYPSYKATPLSPVAALLYNSLSIRSIPGSMRLGDAACSVSLLPSCPLFSPRCSAELMAGGHRCTAEASDTFFLIFHNAFAELRRDDAAVPDERAFPEEVRSAILQALFAPLLGSLSKALSAPIEITSARFTPQGGTPIAAAAALCFSLSFENSLPVPAEGSGLKDSDPVFLRIAFANGDDAAAAAGLFHALPPRRNGFLTAAAAGIPIDISFEAGHVSLPADAVKSLGSGDVLIPDEWTLPGRLTARILQGPSSHLAAECSHEGPSATLSTPFTDDTYMESTETNDIELRLGFELERRQITFAELSALEPGYVFALNCDEQSPVTIRVNGKALATGRLVDLNGTLGVQVLQTL